MGREEEPSEGKQGQERKHMRGVHDREGRHYGERGETTNLTSPWQTQKQQHLKAEPPPALTGSLKSSLGSFPKPQTSHYSQSEAELCWDLQYLLSPLPHPLSYCQNWASPASTPRRRRSPGARQRPLSAPQGPANHPKTRPHWGQGEHQAEGLGNPPSLPPSFLGGSVRQPPA